MPPFSAAPRRVGTNLSVQFRDFTGKPKTMSGTISAAAAEAEIDAVVAAAGNLSNARVMEQRITEFEVQISNANPLNTAFDEAYASVKDELVVQFQATATGEIREFRVPAPDASLFLPDGETVVVPDSGAAAGSGAELLDNYITAMLVVLGAGFEYARAFKNNSETRPRQALGITEPVGSPGDAPGV